MEAAEVIGNDLLLWMSARGSGSWVQFRAAVERLVPGAIPADDGAEREDSDQSKLPLYQTLRLNFERLGFAEFFAASGEEEWRVAPPVLVIAQSATRQTGFLTGARSDSLMRRIQTTLAPDSFRIKPQENCPDSVVLETDDASLLPRLAASAGLVAQRDAPTAILAALRELSVNDLIGPVDPPLGKEWTFERFRERDLRWEDTGRTDMDRASFGLFRLRFRYRTEILLRWGGRAYQTGLAEGKYLALKRVRKRVLVYDPADASLVVPAICRPPILIDRALILCSGQLPRLEIRGNSAYLHYQDIPSAVAWTAASLLRQGLL
jgi:hypothetical protein